MSKTITNTITTGISLIAGYDPLSITGSGAVVVSFGTAIYGDAVQSWQVVNAGLVAASSPFGVDLSPFAIDLKSASLVTNTGTIIASSAGAEAVRIDGGRGTVINRGIILGGLDGVVLTAGGTVVNTGSIHGTDNFGVYIGGGGGTVTNAGTIAGTTGGALSFHGSYTDRLIIGPGAVFQGKVLGGSGSNTMELAAGAIGTVGGFGTSFIGFGTVTVDTGANWQFDNTGTFGGGVFLTDAGMLDNVGVIGATVTVVGGGSLRNTGTINTYGAAYGVTLVDGGVVSNSGTGALIEGSALYAIRADGAAATVTNSGSIIGNSATSAGGGVGLEAGGTVVNTGVILGPAVYGVRVKGGEGLVVNTGTIAGYYGVGLRAGGLVDNSGTIIGSGQENGFGVYFSGGPGTLTNAGTIIGGPGGAAYFHGSHTDRLILDPGAVFQGLVRGGSGSNTMELAAGTAGGTGTLSEFGPRFIGFGTVTVDSGADWLFDNTGTFGAGVLLSDAGTLTNAGSIDVTVTVTGGGTLSNTGTIAVGRTALGVTLVGGGVVNNSGAGALIEGGKYSNNRYAIAASGAAATVINSGSIIGSPGNSSGGVGLYAGGTVVNAGVILGPGYYGVYVTGGEGLVVNTGTIASYDGGVGLRAGGTVDNTGTILSGGGRDYNVYFNGGAGTLINAGTILEGAKGAVSFQGSYTDRLIIDPGAVFQGLVKGGSGSNTMELAAGTAGATGTVGGLGTLFTGFGQIGIDAGASWTLTGANNLSNGVVLTNAGVLTLPDATLTVGTVVNTGIVLGYANIAIYAAGGDGLVTNTGIITDSRNASAEAVRMHGGLGTVINGGTILGGLDGVVLTAGGTVVNAGSIGVAFNAGVYIGGGDGTLTNAGTISATKGVAVSFHGSYADRLIIDPGAVFQGNVLGGSGTNTLELAAGTAGAIGTLSGLGTRFTGFGQIGIDSKASWTLTGANSLSTGVTLTNAGTLTLSDATLTGGILINNRAIILDPSDVVVAGLYGNGTVTIAAGSTLDVQGTVASHETIVFGGAGAYLHIDAPGSFAGSITNFGRGDRLDIDLAGITPPTASYSGSTLHFGASGRIALKTGAPLPVEVTTSPDGDLFSVMCFCANTRILTPAGERPVQDLAAGDLVVTHGGLVRPVTWVGVGTVQATCGRRTAATPVIVRKGALGDNVPVRDLRITKGHALFLDGVLIPVEFLVNHRTILWDDRAQQVSLYHIELDAHDVLIADGAPAESYRDDGNRWLFDNASTGWGLPPQPPCAPVLTGGAIVDAAWRRLADRAGPRAAIALTADPDLHLLVDGMRLDLAWRIGAAHAFKLEQPPGSVRIASRAVEPQVLGLARDPRRLGVALRRVEVQWGKRLRVTEADDPLLTDGFHAFEPDNRFRWTDGEAELPLALLDGWDGPLEIVLTVGATTHYRQDSAPAA